MINTRSLEQRVRQEVDSWEIKGEPTHHTPSIKPVLYGVGIDITEKIIEYIKKNNPQIEITQIPVGRVDLNFSEALADFEKKYIIWHYIKNKFNASKTAKSINMSRQHLYTTFRKNNIVPEQIKEKGMYCLSPPSEDYQDDPNIVDFAVKEIQKYISASKLFKEKIAKRFIAIASGYLFTTISSSAY